MAFVRAARKDEIPQGTIREFQIEGRALAISNVDGKFYAISNTCLHRGGPLAQGTLSGKIVTCPWHGWQFDVRSGKTPLGPKIKQAVYEVKIDDQDVLVSVP